jgi:hypothetical protein
MTDEPHLTRFLVRRGARRGWMVWDRHIKGPAKYLGYAVPFASTPQMFPNGNGEMIRASGSSVQA